MRHSRIKSLNYYGIKIQIKSESTSRCFSVSLSLSPYNKIPTNMIKWRDKSARTRPTDRCSCRVNYFIETFTIENNDNDKALCARPSEIRTFLSAHTLTVPVELKMFIVVCRRTWFVHCGLG